MTTINFPSVTRKVTESRVKRFHNGITRVSATQHMLHDASCLPKYVSPEALNLFHFILSSSQGSDLVSLAQGRVYNALLVGGGSQVRVNKSNNLDTLALEIGSMLILFIEVSSTNIVHHLS